jgi:1-aminocyclopropane-1-carboxylate deaminase
MVNYNPIISTINFQGHLLDVLRLDLIHPHYGGNKYFKLKYNLEKAKRLDLNQILTFGGAHSNHIYSTAAACKEFGFKAIGVIRGEENLIEQSPTLKFALECRMKLRFVSREEYKSKTEEKLLAELEEEFGKFYLVPEGGSNKEGVEGCTEILTEELKKYDYVFCACGTAATFSGIKISKGKHQNVIGISVLKGENKLIEDANNWFKLFASEEISLLNSGTINQSTIINEYHFGGYAKFSKELVAFKNDFEKQYNITLDYIYTAKLFFAVFDLIKQNRLKLNSKVLIVHSGGQQVNSGFEKRYSI